MRDERKGYLFVGHGHKIYYETFGNPDGIPLICLHGGPGSGFSRKYNNLFNPKKFFVIMFDQRGCGRSRPLGSLSYNNTIWLAKDVNKLMKFFNIKSAILYGSSWGSTLALYFAILYPKKVSHLFLTGLFCSTKQEINYIYEGGLAKFGASNSIIWDKPHETPIRKFLFKRISVGSKKRKLETFKIFSIPEGLADARNKNAYLNRVKHLKWRPDFVIPLYYAANDFFIPEGYFFKNKKILNKIPITIIQGRGDKITIPNVSIQFRKKISKAKVFFVEGGHSQSYPKKNKMIKAMLNRIAI